MGYALRCLLVCLVATSCYGQGTGLRTYLDENNPYYPSLKFPKLVTPQWVGEDGVEAVIILGIDDMRDPVKYDHYLRPILKRLKKIDGRAPVSIMTNSIKPNNPHLQVWLDEGLSLECHTIDHPCPLLKDGDFGKARSTYERCIDLMASIPRNKPVAFRMPCCDSLNTVSPRFYSEIFNKTTEENNSLTIDTSVFQFFTSDDPEIPRELVIDSDGQEKFLKYLPRDRGFVNYIENYPYPYVINKLCWEFPCLGPSDWSAQHRHGVNNPITVADWKAAIDITVIKQGVMCLVFHPHGWIRNDQIVELIDHATQKHGKKVKFLTFKEAADRLQKHFLRGRKMRPMASQRMRFQIDSDRNFLGISLNPLTRGKHAEHWVWAEGIGELRAHWREAGFIGGPGGFPFYDQAAQRAAEQRLQQQPTIAIDIDANLVPEMTDFGLKPGVERTLKFPPFLAKRIREIAAADDRTRGDAGRTVLADHQLGLRSFDINQDGKPDLIYSDEEMFAVCLFSEADRGWSTVVVNRKRSPKAEPGDIPPIVRSDFTDNGFFVHGRAMYWTNEDTAKEPHLVIKRTFDDVLAKGRSERRSERDRESFSEDAGGETQGQEPEKDSRPRLPQARSPEVSLKCIDVREGFRVELVASEPLIRDPVAFDWLPDGRMIVVEMGGYPNGVEASKQSAAAVLPGSTAPMASNRRGGATGSQTQTRALKAGASCACDTRADEQSVPPAGTADPANGRVRILEDTDSDGVYDKATTFLDRLNFPTGVMPWRNGVLISAAPEIFYAEDTDGDGKADRREVLFTGFAEGNQQHRVNGFEYGLDNWVYVANGDSGGTIRSVRTGKTLDMRGHDIRIKPDTGAVERVTGQTQFGRHRDAYGNWFGCNNSNPLWHYVLEEKYITRNKHFAPPDSRHNVMEIPGNSPVFPISTTEERFNDFHTANRFTSACSTIIYDDELFGPHFKHNAFICEPVHNLISRRVLRPDGVTFKGKRAVDEQDREFLASTDNWFRPVFVRTGPDGALWIADMYRHVIEHPKWIPDDWQQKLDLRAGDDKGRIYRVTPVAARPMRDVTRFPIRGEAAELENPSRWVRDTAQRIVVTSAPVGAEVRARSIASLRDLVVNAVTPETRLQALCALQGCGGLTAGVIRDASLDVDPSVRRQAIRLFGNRRHSMPERLMPMVADPHDKEVLHLAYTLGASSNPNAAPTLVKLLEARSADRYVAAAILSSVNDANIGPLLESATRPNIPIRFSRDLFRAAAAGSDETRLAAFGAIRNSQARLDPKAVPHEQFVRTGTRNLRMMTALMGHASLRQLQRVIDFRPWVAELMYGLPNRGILASKHYGPDYAAASVECMGVLLRLHKDLAPVARKDIEKQLTGPLLRPGIHPRVRSAVVDELARFQGTVPAEILLEYWPRMTPDMRARAFGHLLTTKEWTLLLLTAIEQKTIESVFDAGQRQRLLEHREKAIRERASRLFSKQTRDRSKVVAKYAQLAGGTASRGRTVFEKRCASCHQVSGIGKQIGADLVSLRDKSVESLLIAILDPNRAVESRFLGYTVVTNEGKSLSGMIKAESGNAITLIGSDGNEQTILRSEIDELACTNKSLMPEGLEKDLTAKDLADVIAFLQAAGLDQPKSIAGNQPKTIKPGEDGTIRLTATDCRIYGPSLTFESHYGNLGFWASKDDLARWQAKSIRPGRYRVLITYAAPAAESGKRFQLLLRHSTDPPVVLKGTVAATGSWNKYRQTVLDEVEVAGGTLTIEARSVGPVKGYLWDLREVLLSPVRQ